MTKADGVFMGLAIGIITTIIAMTIMPIVFPTAPKLACSTT